MASRSVGRVVLSFGMAQIAIKLYKAAASEAVSFNMINPITRNRISQKLVDKEDGTEVQRGDCLKGYEYAADQFVVFTDEEIENMQAAKKDSLEISEFVPTSEINPLHVENTYYTAPDKGMDKGYRFLYELLKTNSKAAIGIYVARGKEHLVAIQAYKHGLIMYQMFYDTEVREFDNKCANIPISAIELAMGKVLMDTLSKPTFDSSKYSDKFILKLNTAVAAKIADPTSTITAVTTMVSTGGMADTLRASLLSIGVPEAEIDRMVAGAMADASGLSAITPATPTPEPLILTAPEAKPARRSRAKKAS